MKPYRLQRAGAVDLAFEGECLADLSSRESGRPRWTEIRIYRTSTGKYVTEVVGRSSVPSEVDRLNVRVVDTADGIAEALARKGNDRHTIVPGDPNRSYLTELAIEAIEKAAESDEAIKATLVEEV